MRMASVDDLMRSNLYVWAQRSCTAKVSSSSRPLAKSTTEEPRSPVPASVKYGWFLDVVMVRRLGPLGDSSAKASRR
ncbi:hypothetical protein HYQ46_009004 [Verticillium longisporum]|nr:hypothetical protein HYQ46_009004 [Verticillium longisporum]